MYNDIGKEIDPDVFSINGGPKKVSICAPISFLVAYAIRTKEHNHWATRKTMTRDMMTRKRTVERNGSTIITVNRRRATVSLPV